MRLLAFSLLAALGLSGKAAWSADGMIALQNDALRVEIDAATGNLATVENRRTGQVLLRASGQELAAPAWNVKFLEAASRGNTRDGNSVSPQRCHVEQPASGRVRLVWEADRGIEVEADLTLAAGAAPFEARATVRNQGQGEIESFEYPILRGIQQIGADLLKTDFVTPYKEGHLFHNPFEILDTLGPARPNLFSFTYPRGHNLTMQFFALYEQGRGGFYLATHDGRQTVKDFDLGIQGKTRVFSVTQQNWDCRPGQGMTLDYPFVIAAMTEGSWQEAADRYKQWAVAQVWAKRPLSERRKSIGWLFDRAGFSVFGISAAEDQRSWYQAFHEIAKSADAQVLFVAAGNWRALWGQDAGATSGTAGAHFLENLDVVQKNGDAMVPFYFDMRMQTNAPSWREKVLGDAGSPWSAHAIQKRLLPSSTQEEAETEFGGEGAEFLCPSEKAFVDFHRARDERLIGNGGLDGAYYDISINLAPTGCFAPNHNHPPGWGRWIFDAYRNVFDESRRGGSQARGKPIILGTEQITEGTLDTVDFYHLGGAGLGPIRRPGVRFDAMIMTGRCRQIPLFAYVYHEIGPLRTGGKIQISTDFGDAWYFIAGQEYLWGGVIELIYFNTPLELFPGTTPPTLKTGFGPAGKAWENNPRHADPRKIDFLRECAALRTGPGREFLAYGTMLRQPPIESPINTLNLDFWHYADIKGPKFSRKGTFPCPELLREAWRAPDGRIGLFFVNLHGDKPLEIHLPKAPLQTLCSLPKESRLVVQYPEDLSGGNLQEFKESWRIQLPPRHPVLIETNH